MLSRFLLTCAFAGLALSVIEGRLFSSREPVVSETSVSTYSSTAYPAKRLLTMVGGSFFERSMFCTTSGFVEA